MLDRARDAGSLASGYQQVYLQLAVIALVVGTMAWFLRPPHGAHSKL
jgi:hypothetical protein